MMKTVLTASTYAVTGTVTVNQNASTLYEDTSNASNPARITHTTASTTAYYLYLRGFNFSAIPDNATVSGITITIKGYESGLSTSTTYAPRLYNGTTTITGASAASSSFSTSTKTITVPYTGTWATLKSYGSDLGIRLSIKRSNKSTQGYLYIYGAQIEVTYTTPYYVKKNGSWINVGGSYSKTSGSWQMANIETVFYNEKIYVNHVLS